MKKINGNRQEDWESVKRISKGDMSEFRKLVEKYKDISFSLACSILKDEDEAKDALQDAFMKVLNNIHKFRFDSLFSTWLYRIVVTTCLNIKGKTKKHLYDDLSDLPDAQIDTTSSFDTFTEKERSAYIATALKLMKPEEALLLRLYYLCELSVSEITQVTDLTKSNIKVILFRGRKNMYRILERLLRKDLSNLL